MEPLKNQPTRWDFFQKLFGSKPKEPNTVNTVGKTVFSRQEEVSKTETHRFTPETKGVTSRFDLKDKASVQRYMEGGGTLKHLLREFENVYPSLSDKDKALFINSLDTAVRIKESIKLAAKESTEFPTLHAIKTKASVILGLSNLPKAKRILEESTQKFLSDTKPLPLVKMLPIMSLLPKETIAAYLKEHPNIGHYIVEQFSDLSKDTRILFLSSLPPEMAKTLLPGMSIQEVAQYFKVHSDNDYLQIAAKDPTTPKIKISIENIKDHLQDLSPQMSIHLLQQHSANEVGPYLDLLPENIVQGYLQAIGIDQVMSEELIPVQAKAQFLSTFKNWDQITPQTSESIAGFVDTFKSKVNGFLYESLKMPDIPNINLLNEGKKNFETLLTIQRNRYAAGQIASYEMPMNPFEQWVMLARIAGPVAEPVSLEIPSDHLLNNLPTLNIQSLKPHILEQHGNSTGKPDAQNPGIFVSGKATKSYLGENWELNIMAQDSVQDGKGGSETFKNAFQKRLLQNPESINDVNALGKEMVKAMEEGHKASVTKEGTTSFAASVTFQKTNQKKAALIMRLGNAPCFVRKKSGEVILATTQEKAFAKDPAEAAGYIGSSQPVSNTTTPPKPDMRNFQMTLVDLEEGDMIIMGNEALVNNLLPKTPGEAYLELEKAGKAPKLNMLMMNLEGMQWEGSHALSDSLQLSIIRDAYLAHKLQEVVDSQKTPQSIGEHIQNNIPADLSIIVSRSASKFTDLTVHEFLDRIDTLEETEIESYLTSVLSRKLEEAELNAVQGRLMEKAEEYLKIPEKEVTGYAIKRFGEAILADNKLDIPDLNKDYIPKSPRKRKPRG